MKHKKIKILHITPHLGTGVGTVVLNYLQKVKESEIFEHSIVCLDYANELAKSVAKASDFYLDGDMSKRPDELLKMIEASDVVLIHWWNHPLLTDFLVRQTLPANRLITWSHIQGSPAPNNFTPKTLKYPDKMIFTTPLSYEVKEVKDLFDQLSSHFGVVWSTGGVERLGWLKPTPHSGFNIGYIGSLDFTKMHPDFFEICNKIDIPNVKFVVVGGPNDKAEFLRNKATEAGLSEKFVFTGFVPEAEKWQHLATFDVFGYPLAPHHYGTCDQVLQEAMAIGIVPVVLNNPMENLMVKNNECGLVADDITGYIKAIENLHQDDNLRNKLSQNAKQYAQENYSLAKMEKQWNQIFEELLTKPKTVKIWPLEKESKDITANDVFIESLGEYGRPFIDYCQAKDEVAKQVAVEAIKELAKSPNWRSTSKSTVHQYSAFFPEDKILLQWSSLMK